MPSRWPARSRKTLGPRAATILVIFGILLALAWRNAGWIGLDRWFLPWMHRTFWATQTAASERETSPTVT
jgi:hypothetical protein